MSSDAKFAILWLDLATKWGPLPQKKSSNHWPFLIYFFFAVRLHQYLGGVDF